MKTGCGKTRD